MLGTAQRLWTRIVSTRRLAARTALLAVLAMAFGAAPAYADGASGPEAPTGGEQSLLTPEGGGSAGDGSGEPPAEEQVSSPPPEPQAQPESSESPAPAEVVVAETPPPAEAPPPAETAETPPPAETPPVAESPSVPGPEREGSGPEAPVKGKTDEKSAVAAALPAATGGSAGGTTGEPAPANLAGAPTGTMVIDLGEATITKETSAAARAAVTGKPGAGGGGDGLGCALPGLGGPTAGSCATASWVRLPGALAPEVVSPAPVSTALVGAVAATRTSGGDPGGSAGGGRPMSPTPGPAPSGASGGAAAGGAGGVGLSGFLAFAVLLLLAAPRAMRRLRLACQPWLTAFFVLIPERPG